MSGRSGGKQWSASMLRKRGWTRELMWELLPKPRYVPAGSRRVPLWDREDVQAAENSPRFLQRGGDGGTPPPPGAALALDALSRRWDEAERDASAPWLLAAHYHRAICKLLPRKARGASTSQASSWLGQFLSLEKRCTAQQLPEVMKNFIRSGGWLGDHLAHPLAEDVLSRYPQLLHTAAVQAAADFTAAQPESALEGLLTAEGFPAAQLLTEGLGTVWSVWYVPRAIRTSLSLLIALNPKDEYPEARAMHRRFILHLGGTNTGKTYAGFQRLKQAPSGVYLAPLRLLALEAQETMVRAGVNCSLSTGEEEDFRDDDTHMAATAEKLDLKRYWDAAVIDECQMIADRQRGYAWTRAILGVLSPEVHLCAAPEAKDLLIRDRKSVV